MLRHGRPVGPEFAESAPVRMAFGAEVAAPPAAVYRELAERGEDWPDWFGPLVAVARTPQGRQVRLRGGGQFWETVLVAEPDTRYVYRTDRTNAPGVTALVEAWLLVPAGGATRVRWTVGTDGTALYRAVLRAARPAIGRAFRDAMRALERRLTLPEG